MVGIVDGDRLSATLAELRSATGGSWGLEDEMRAIAGLPGERAEEIRRRLFALVPLVSDRGRRGAVGEAAASIGVSRRSVHNLLERLIRLSPVEAVTPRAGAGRTTRARAERAHAVDRDLIDAELRSLLKEEWTATLATAVRRVSAAFREAGHDPPAALTVSRRLDAARSTLNMGEGIGARVLVGTSPIAAAGYREGRFVPLCVALIVDADDGTIMGWGSAAAWEGASALLNAIDDFAARSECLRLRNVARSVVSFEVDAVPGVDPGVAGSTRGALTKAGLKRLLGGAPAASLLRPRASRRVREIDDDELSTWLVLDRRTMPLVLEGIFGMAPPPSEETRMPVRPDAVDELAGRLSQLREQIAGVARADFGSLSSLD